MLPALLILLVCVPILELYVIIQVGQGIGVIPTLVLLVVMSILGGAFLRAQGRATWRAFNEALRESRVPAREVIDGALVILGGALLLTPGFITDVFGFLLLAPPTRALLRRMLVTHFAVRFIPGGPVVADVAGAAASRSSRAPRRRSSPFATNDEVRPAGDPRDPRSADVDGSAEDVDPPGRPPRDELP